MNTLPDLPVFFDASCAVINAQYELTEVEAHHALHVMRLQEGASIIISNGKGVLWKALISETNRNSLHYQTIEELQSYDTSPFVTSIACGILGAAQRMETMVEKLVEIGTKEIIFYSSARTGRHKSSLKRLEKVAIAALKQSRKAFLPTIHITTIEGLLNFDVPNRLMASCIEPSPPHLQDIKTLGENLVVIGPEGDFTTQELEAFEHNGFTLCSLGSERLRSETAAVYAFNLSTAKTFRLRTSLLLAALVCIGFGFKPDGAIKIARLKYSGGGDWYANPTSMPNLIRFANQNLGCDIDPNEEVVTAGSEEIFNYPFIHMTGHGNVILSDAEAENLRLYLLSGGFLHIDDNYGMDPFVRLILKKVFPDKDLVELPYSHDIYHQKFDFNQGLPKIHEHDGSAPTGYAIMHEGRALVYYTFECDLGDGWEDEEVHNDPYEIRMKALKMGANILQYAFIKN